MALLDDGGRVLDAEFDVEPDGTHLAVVMHSRSGVSGTRAPRNPDYNQALTILLRRLGQLNAVLVDALVDSRLTRTLELPEADRRLIEAPIRLALEPDMDALRRRMGTAQAKIGQSPDATKGGNATKRIRLRLEVPGYQSRDAARLATRLAERMGTTPTGPDGHGHADPLRRFAPKDSSDYLARLAGRVLVKSRAHEDLVRDYGLWAEGQGYMPFTLHPRDLVLEKSGVEWLVEAKMLYDGNAAEAVRAAVGQLFDYRHFFYAVPGRPPPRLLGLFSQPIGGAYVEFLESLSIASVWRSAGSWAGSSSAVAAGLAARR